MGHTRIEPLGGPWLPYGCTLPWRPGWQRASFGSGKAQVPGLGPGEPSQGPVCQDDLTPCLLARHSRTEGACSPEVPRLSCHPRRHTHGQLGQWDRRPAAPSAEPGPLVAPGALLNPASEADGRGARPKEIRGAQWGADESGRGRAAVKAHAGKTGPAWWKSRGGSLRRGREAGEPPGPKMRNPGPLARMGAMGSHPSRGPGGASRIACTPQGLKRVSA